MVSATRNAPVEMSIQASAKACSAPPFTRPSAIRKLDSDGASSLSSVMVPGVTSRTTSRRTTDLPPRFFASAGSSICSQTATRNPWPDQLLQIVVGGMHRHAAHRNVEALVLAAFGQHDAERPARLLGIVEEQLVEIAHAIEQQRIRVRRLDLDELLDHRRGAWCGDRRRRRGGLDVGIVVGVIRGAHIHGGTLADVAGRFNAGGSKNRGRRGGCETRNGSAA